MMSDWTMTTLGKQITLQRGFDITRAEQRGGGVPVVSSGGITSYHDTAAVKGPGVVIGRKGVVGSVFYLEGDYWPHDTTLWVKDFHGNDPRFSYYFLRCLIPMFKRLDVGSANPTLNRNHVHPLEIAWPPLSEQRAIGFMLGALDDKIDLNRKMIATLEAMARALFKSWFVDFDPVRAKVEGRGTGLSSDVASLFPDSFQQSEIGEVPGGWRVTCLGEQLVELEVGSRPKGGIAGYTHGVPSIGAESIVGLGLFDYSKTKYVPDEFFAKMNKGHVKNRDVLLYKDGGRPGQFEPHVAMFGDGFPFTEYAINEHVYRIRATADIGQTYLFFWLSTGAIMEEMRVKGTGVAVPGLNSTQVRSLTTLVPDGAVIHAYERLGEPLISRVLACANESRTLQKLRDTLLPKLISGEIGVAAAERIVAKLA